MNTKEIIDGLEEINYSLPHSLIPDKAIELIESLQAQLAKEKRRAEKAIADLKLCGGELCEYCAKFNKFDAKKPWPCDKPCKDACEWQWRGDAEAALRKE